MAVIRVNQKDIDGAKNQEKQKSLEEIEKEIVFLRNKTEKLVEQAAKMREEKKHEAAKKLAEDKTVRFKQIQADVDRLNDDLKAFLKDYGSIDYIELPHYARILFGKGFMF